MSAMMASAIALPEDATDQTSTTENGLKRRQSDASEREQEAKRKRTSPGKNSPPTPAGDENQTQSKSESATVSTPAQEEEDKGTRRRTGVGDEKQRSKRLFGALLGNLNQPGDRVSKRRAEIEQRRKAELQKQDDERVEDRQRRLDELVVQRKRGQIKVDEQIMRTRHEHMLDMANFLYTRTEPRLYYRPWDLLPDEEDRVDDQIDEAQSQIDKELKDWKEEKRRRLKEFDEASVNESVPESDGGVQGLSTEHIGNGTAQTTQEEAAETGKVVTGQKIQDDEIVVATTEPVDIEDVVISESQEALATTEEQREQEGGEAKQEETASDLQDEAKEDAEEEGHMVEGDEDDVIY